MTTNISETVTSNVPEIRVAVAGRHTRYMLAAYLRHTFMVTGALLAIALTIDMWPQLAAVQASAPGGFIPVLLTMLRFASLRGPDLIIPFLPFATFLGVVWTEILMTESRERLLVWNSGRSPLHCLAPVIALGLIMGVLDFGMDVFLRPAFMNVQIHEKLGTKGEEFARAREGGPITWIALDHGREGLLKARLISRNPIELADVTLYRFDQDGSLTEVDTAMLASPLSGDARWVLRNGKFWRASTGPSDAGVHFTIATAPEAQTPFTEKIVTIDVSQLWLANRGISVQYLPLSIVRHLAFEKGGSLRSDDFRTHLEVKYSELFLPGEMALFASCLSMLLIPYAISTAAVIWIVLAGYLAHFGSKAMLLLGSNSYADAYVAGWLVPVALGICIALVMRRIEAKRRIPEWWAPVRHESAASATAESPPSGQATEMT